MHHFPALKSPIRAARVARQNDDQSLVSDWLIPLCSGPGFESKRLKYATKTMDSFDATAPHETVCCLVEDERNHSSAFYSMAQNRTKFLKLILKHERNWQVFMQIKLSLTKINYPGPFPALDSQKSSWKVLQACCGWLPTEGTKRSLRFSWSNWRYSQMLDCQTLLLEVQLWLRFPWARNTSTFLNLYMKTQICFQGKKNTRKQILCFDSPELSIEINSFFFQHL